MDEHAKIFRAIADGMGSRLREWIGTEMGRGFIYLIGYGSSGVWEFYRFVSDSIQKHFQNECILNPLLFSIPL